MQTRKRLHRRCSRRRRASEKRTPPIARRGDAIQAYIEAWVPTITGLVVTFDATASRVSILASLPIRPPRESAALLRQRRGRIERQRQHVGRPEAAAKRLSRRCAVTSLAIAKAAYGDGRQISGDLEANQSMPVTPTRSTPARSCAFRRS